jgi:hypothetical protein
MTFAFNSLPSVAIIITSLSPSEGRQRSEHEDYFTFVPGPDLGVGEEEGTGVGERDG